MQLAGVLFLGWCCLTVEALPNEFVIVSDTQNIDGVDEMTKQIIELEPAFVIAVGDVPSAFDARVDCFRRLREAGLDVHIAMGNHDHGPKLLVRSLLPPYPLNREVDPVLRFVVENKYYYSFNRGRIHFVIVDTCTDDKEKEIEWLKADLIDHVNNPNRYPSIVFMHYPDWMMRRDDGTGGPVYQVLAEHSEKHTVIAAFAGHTHKGKLYPAEQTLGIPLYTLHPSAPFGADLHTEYVVAKVDPGQIRFERRVVLDDGKSGDFTIAPLEGKFTNLRETDEIASPGGISSKGQETGMACVVSGPLVPCATADTDNSRSPIVIHGLNGTSTVTTGGLTTYLGGGFDLGPPIVCARTDDRTGQWAVTLDAPGTYTATVEEADGLGPVLRPGITLREEGFDRVQVVLPFAYDLLGGSQRSENAHTEFGQTFIAAGTEINGIVFENADGVLVSLHEENAQGPQVGPTVHAAAWYPQGSLPTKVGGKYYLRFTRSDGAPFRMGVREGNPYHDGSAYFDGHSQPSLDMAMRIQICPDGQIVRCKPGHTEVYRPARRCYGQAFVARGTGLALFSCFPAYGGGRRFEPTVRFFESGPDGKPIGEPVTSRIVVLNPDELKLVAGRRYYVEVSADLPPGELKMWTSHSDDFEGGELFVDGEPVPERDLAMILVEYEADEARPPMPTATSYSPGTPPYAQRFPASGKVRLVWDIPASNDICGAVVRRLDVGQGASQGDEEIIARMPVSARGRYQYVDTGLEDDRAYRYTIRTVDVAGNESEPLNAPVVPCPRVPMAAALLNADLRGPSDAWIPLGWQVRTIAGATPAFRVEPGDGGQGAPSSAGWEVPEGAGRTDTVFFQRVPCEAGRAYELRAEVRLWNPWNNREMVIFAVIGIDPNGGTDPLSPSVVWSSPTHEREKWVPLRTSAKAESDWMTVYLRGYSQYTRLMNTRFRLVGLEDVTR